MHSEYHSYCGTAILTHRSCLRVSNGVRREENKTTETNGPHPSLSPCSAAPYPVRADALGSTARHFNSQPYPIPMCVMLLIVCSMHM
jgi:hypothetical protein